MTSPFSFTKLRNAMGSAGSAAAPAPDAAPSAPSSKSKSSTGFGGLHGRENLAQSGGMAPRGRSPMMQAFSSAAQHARGAVHQFSQGMRQEVQQHKHGFSAFRAESHAASRPNFGYNGVAQNHRLAQASHQQNAQRAYSQAAGHARAFFGETAHGVSQGARQAVLQAAYPVLLTMQRFDPRRLADKAARYGNAALHQATNVAMVGLGGALLAGAAVADGVHAARYKVGQVVHSVDNALRQAEYAIHNAGHRINQTVQSATHQVGYMAQTALHHATYPIRAAAHTYESLSHAASVFKQDMARFDPYRMSHQYQQYQARPQWY